MADRQVTRRFFGFLFLLLAWWMGGGQPVAAAPAGFTELRAEYRGLFKTDPEVTDLERWEAVAARLAEFVEAESSGTNVPRAEYLLGRLYEQMYLKRRSTAGLSRSMLFYERLARDHQKHRLADDALLRLGDLRRSALGDEAGARAAYYEIIDVYGTSDSASRAKERLGLGAERSPEKPETRASEPAATDGEASEALLPQLFSSREKSRTVFAAERTVKRPLVVIDPGHGGEDLGAVGVDGVLEKDVVLQIAFMLDELLRERLRAQTHFTRTTDVELPLADRTALANRLQADVFVSIHANASENGRAHGIETYYLDNTNDKSSLKLAERENLRARSEVGDIGFIFSDLIQNLKLEDSISLAHHLQNSLVKRLSRYYGN
ncbi:MAG: N-acetylmuramoyl-L-alanine amidase, partial [Bdellovibrionales bacterium]|nr:N-acetylmuramoyl-L-alanine amidase [Bdellovibrionales bacterium]